MLVQSSAGLRIPFDRGRLARSVERARTAASGRVSGQALGHASGHASGHTPGKGGTPDRPELTEEIADIVAFTLRNLSGEAGGTVVAEDDLGDLVERALLELGAIATARSYIVVRDRRARSAAARGGSLEDAPGGSLGGSSRASAPNHGARLPMVRGASGAEPFHARRIVGALMEEAALLPEEAEQVAQRVEDTLRSAGLHSVSTALVRELVSNELLGLGFRDALKRHEAIGIPRHNLGELFHSARALGPGQCVAGDPLLRAAAAPRFEQTVASALLRKWSLSDLLSADVADAHLAGDIHIEGLEAPHRALYRAIAADLIRPRGSSAPGEDAGRLAPFALIEGAVELARDVERGLFLEGIGACLVPWLSQVSGGGRGKDADRASVQVAAWLIALGGAAASAGRTVDLVAPTAHMDPRKPPAGEILGVVSSLLLGAKRGLSHATSIPRLFLRFDELMAALELDGQRAEPAAAAAEQLLASGHLVPTWCEVAESRYCGPGLIRRTGDDPPAWAGSLALDSAISINLPRVARKAGPWREDAFLMGLNDVVEVAMSAAVERSSFMARARTVHGTAARDKASFGMVPVGLYEALRILGDGLARADQGARILGFLHDAAVRKGAERGLEVRVVSSIGTVAPGRFATLDALMGGGQRQARLFSDMPRPEQELAHAYRAGLGDLSASEPNGEAREEARVAARAESLGTLLRTLPCGMLIPTQWGAPVVQVRGQTGQGRDVFGLGSDRRGTATGGGMLISGDAGTVSPRESTAASRDPYVAALVRERPRLHAWSQMEAIRSPRTKPSPPRAETTLF